MFELGDAGIVLIHGVVHRAVALKILLEQRLKAEIQGTVGQGAKAEAKQLVRLAGVDHRAGEFLPLPAHLVSGDIQAGQSVPPQLHGDIGVVQHLLKHRGIALQRHSLISILKIPVIPGQEHRHPGRGVGVDLLRLLSPLLHGVAHEDVVVHIIGQGGDLGIGVLPKL